MKDEMERLYYRVKPAECKKEQEFLKKYGVIVVEKPTESEGNIHG